LFWNVYTKNILLAVLISIALVLGVLGWLKFYTHHGEQVGVPATKGLKVEEALLLLHQAQIEGVVIDSIYIKNKEPGSIIETVPPEGTHVKKGRKIYITINAGTAHHLTVPSVMDMSRRQALSLLSSIGFEEVTIRDVPGPYPDLVVGLTDTKGKTIQTGDRLPADEKLILLVNSGESISGFSDSTEVSAATDDSNLDESWF
jgi:beta-lactam-binding protein with PASTA domain